MSNNLLRNALGAYLLLGPLAIVFMLFYVRTDFLLQFVALVLIAGGYVFLWTANRFVR